MANLPSSSSASSALQVETVHHTFASPARLLWPEPNNIPVFVHITQSPSNSESQPIQREKGGLFHSPKLRRISVAWADVTARLHGSLCVLCCVCVFPYVNTWLIAVFLAFLILQVSRENEFIPGPPNGTILMVVLHCRKTESHSVIMKIVISRIHRKGSEEEQIPAVAWGDGALVLDLESWRCSSPKGRMKEAQVVGRQEEKAVGEKETGKAS